MLTQTIVEELTSIQLLIDSALYKMEDLLSPRAKNIFWRLFFPAGQFLQQKSVAREASLLLLKADIRLREMNEVLKERKHPLASQISEFLNIDLVTMSENLVELPERAQYMISQITSVKKALEVNIKELTG